MNLFKKWKQHLAKHYRPAIELKNLYSLSVAAVPEQPYYLTLFPNILILKEQTVIQMVRIMKGGLSMTSADVTEEIVCNMHNHYWKNVLKESCDKRARAGEIKDFTGISSPYEAPADPELVIETDKLTMEESVARVMQLLRKRGIKEQ